MELWGGLHQKHEKVMLFTKESDGRTEMGRARVMGKRKTCGIVGGKQGRHAVGGAWQCPEALPGGLREGLPS